MPKYYYYKDKQLVVNVLPTTQQNIISSAAASKVPLVDPNLQNPYGIAIQNVVTTTGLPEVWVSNTGSGKVTHYTLDGVTLNPSNLIVPSAGSVMLGSPTGIVYNSTTGFVINSPGTSAAATLIVATQDGLIAAWNQSVNATTFIIMYRADDGAIYKDLEIVGDFIYATDFANGKIDVFDNTFTLQSQGEFPFVGVALERTGIFSPYGIDLINNTLFVSYGLHEGGAYAIKGPGFGIVDQFTIQGQLIRRVIDFFPNTGLNAPYALQSYGCSFAKDSTTDFLVGNEGDGEIHIYDQISGRLERTLKDGCSDPLQIPGLHKIRSLRIGCEDLLLYVAGDAITNGGIFGTIRRVISSCRDCKKESCICNDPCNPVNTVTDPCGCSKKNSSSNKKSKKCCGR
jgi:uncharacterized protein (TIGR03118 family)